RMWPYLTRPDRRTCLSLEAIVPVNEIIGAKTVLFTVFARYGDSIIAFKAINEFLLEHPGKQYILITTRQAAPYAELLITRPIERHAVNKRRDPIRLWRLARALKRHPPDLGLNPWSHGAESEYFISFCRRYLPY